MIYNVGVQQWFVVVIVIGLFCRMNYEDKDAFYDSIGLWSAGFGPHVGLL